MEVKNVQVIIIIIVQVSVCLYQKRSLSTRYIQTTFIYDVSLKVQCVISSDV